MILLHIADPYHCMIESVTCLSTLMSVCWLVCKLISQLISRFVKISKIAESYTRYIQVVFKQGNGDYLRKRYDQVFLKLKGTD